MKENELDKQIAAKISEHEVTPPPSVWKGIQQEIERKENAGVKKIVPWKRIGLAASLLLCLGFALKIFWNAEGEKNNHQHIISLSPNAPAQPGQETINKSVKGPQESKYTQSATTQELRENQIQKENKKATQKVKYQLASSLGAQKKVPRSLRIDHLAKNQMISPEKLSEPEILSLEEIPSREINIRRVNADLDDQNVSYSRVESKGRNRRNLMIKLLNKVSENINLTEKEIRFNQDEEGTITIDLTNPIANTKKNTQEI